MAVKKLLVEGCYLSEQLSSGNQFYKNWRFVLPENGTAVPKHVGYAPLKFVLIKTVHLVGVTDGVPWYQNACFGVLLYASPACGTLSI